MEARGLRNCAALGEVAVDEADHRPGGVTPVDKEFGNASVRDQIASSDRDCPEVLSRIDRGQRKW
jgi:hypothetical protein